MFNPISFKSKGPALALALVIGASSLVAGPAEAQGLGFGFSFGNGGGRPGFYIPRICLTDRQIRQSIRGRGYGNIYLNVPFDERIQVRASKGGYTYLIEFDRCRDRILSRRRLRR